MPGGRTFRVGLLALIPAAAIFAIGYAGVPTPGVSEAIAAQPPVAPAAFKLERGDHICIIGNTLADRMQHDGWLETFLHARHPQHDLTIRNLGFSGDEVKLRIRSADFGTPDQWLSASAPVPQPNEVLDKKVVNPNRFEKAGTKADVIFAFFGYNESFAGEAGLPQFKTDLEAFIKHTLSQKYNGKSAPRLVLFSPIAFENHKSPNLPSGEDINKNLELYSKAMGEVAKANGAHFVNLFALSARHYQESAQRLTINGIHLNDAGNRKLAEMIDALLFPPPGIYGPPDEKLLAKLRPAVLDKSFHWYQRYRVTDGYSTYGGRAWLRFPPKVGQSNYEVVQKELETLDIMTANRDKVIWEIAKGKDAKPDDSNLPQFVPVKTNKPGTGPNGTHLFLSGEEAIGKMTIGKGMKVSLFADESMFPELAKPVQMAWDTKGRLWVAVWPNYPHWKPTEPYNDKLLIFEDTNGDGKADKMTVFAEGLQNPTGFEFYNGGVIVAQAPDLMFLKDTNGDDKADVRERILHGLDTADTHHTSNSFVLDPGGALYFQEGTFHRTQVEDPYGRCKRLGDGGVFRYEPRTQKFEVYVAFSFANPHGHVFDRWGQDIVVDGTGAQPYHAPLFSGYLPGPNLGGRDYPNTKHAPPPQVYQQRTRPCGGMEILSSKHFPPEFDGNLIVTNCIGFQGILRYRLSDLGGSLSGQELEPILSSSDANFRPVDCKTGPDGALYFIDWQNPIIGHMQHNLRDPSRDRTKGRIYKVSYEGRAPSESPKIAGESIEKLLDLLQHPEDRVRSRAKIELGSRKTEDVIPAAKKWAQRPWGGADSTHHVLEALWVHQYHNVVDTDLLKQMLSASDFRARAAAVRVLCYWRDRVPNSLELVKKAAADDHPRVRVEAVRAASFFSEPEAVEAVFIAQEKPADQYVNHVAGETLKALNPIVQKAIAEKRPIKFTTPAGARFFLKSVATDDLLKMDRTPSVYLELLFRPGVRDEFRREALAALAKQDKKPELAVLVNTIKAHDESAATEESVAFDLARLLTAMPMPELIKSRAELEALAAKGRSATTRQMGYVALLSADGAVDKVWEKAAKSVNTLQDVVAAASMVRDPALRAALYPKVKELLGGLPPELAKTVAAGKPAVGRFVRIELPGPQRTLTLAEVEVFSDGVNVARKGRATQTNTASGGVAARGIDGNTSGKYEDGGQTHTREGIENPWWQVDLGREVPIEKIVVWNRADGNLADRLKNYTVRVLDANRKDVFVSERNPTPKEKADFAVGVVSPERVVRNAAMLALASVRGQEGDAFKAIGKFLSSSDDRPAAVQALLRINPRDWPKEDAKGHLDTVMTFIRGLPVAERTTPLALDMMQLGEGLAGLLPADQAKAARKELSEIGVRVIRVGTLFDQMSYDKERLIVQAGKPVEFVFENTDIMPHNFVIVSQGSLEKVGNAAEEFATQAGAAAAQYVPNMPSGVVLLKSKLLQSRQVEQLKFTAPNEPGIYPYVCTYPGHWRRMHGALYVVADLDAYLENPEAYIAKNPLPVKDDLLKFNRPRTEWKLDELADAVKEMEAKGGRNFATGKQMFTVATCVACHKLGGQGNNDFGPDLTKLDPKVFTNSLSVTEHLLEPAKRIEDKYAMYRIVLDSEKVITAMIVEEKDGVVKVIENPLASTKPLELKATAIVERKKLTTSIMPKGLLDKLTKEEILDLLAYVWSKAEPQNKLFQGGHDHGGHGKH